MKFSEIEGPESTKWTLNRRNLDRQRPTTDRYHCRSRSEYRRGEVKKSSFGNEGRKKGETSYRTLYTSLREKPQKPIHPCIR